MSLSSIKLATWAVLAAKRNSMKQQSQFPSECTNTYVLCVDLLPTCDESALAPKVLDQPIPSSRWVEE